MARVRAGLAATRDTGELTAEEQGAARVERARQIAQQLIDAMRGWGTDETQIYNALEGRSQDEVDEIRRQYYDITGHSLERDIRDEMSGSELDRALRLINSGDSGSFRNEFSEYLTEGLNAGGEGIWDWEFVNGSMLVHVDVAFKPDEGLAYDLGKWQTQIADVWNRFALTNSKGQEYPVKFDLRNQSAGRADGEGHTEREPGHICGPGPRLLRQVVPRHARHHRPTRVRPPRRARRRVRADGRGLQVRDRRRDPGDDQHVAQHAGGDRGPAAHGPVRQREAPARSCRDDGPRGGRVDLRRRRSCRERSPSGS